MEQNKIRTYILYAVGEILLVVIGILLALQVNNWNENRKDRREESFYLNKLMLNIAQDTAYLNLRITTIEEADQSLLQFMKEIEDSGIDTFSEPFGIPLLSVHGFTAQTSTMDNLISTGKLDLLQDQVLVDSLFVYYNDLKNFPEQLNNSNDTYTRDTIGPFMLALEGGIFKLQKNTLNDLDKRYLINAIELKAYINSRLKEEYEVALGRADRIIQSIRSRLDGSQLLETNPG